MRILRDPFTPGAQDDVQVVGDDAAIVNEVVDDLIPFGEAQELYFWKVFCDLNHHAEVLGVRDITGAVPSEPLATGFCYAVHNLALKLIRMVLPEIEVAFKRGLYIVELKPPLPCVA